MPHRRAAIALDPDEVREYLTAQPRTFVLVTTGPDGVPDPVPMWYDVDGDGAVCMRTYAKSQKVRNLRRDPRAAGLVEDGTRYAELRGVQFTGRVELVDDPDWIVDLQVRLLLRYEGLDPAHEPAVRAAALQRAPKQVGLRFVPERVVSWDHRKEAGA
jgi:PPOX class probable F420-dependent enzyme